MEGTPEHKRTSGMHVDDNIRCFFSFRSPYAWLAFHRLQALVAAGGPAIDFVPLIPPRGFLDDMDPRKLRYIGEDVRRIASAYGLELHWPDPFDTEWLRPHAAFLHAADAGRGMPFGAAVFRARFCEGRDVGDAQVLRDIAVAAGLEPEAIIAAGDSRAQRSRIIAGMRSIKEHGVFGVPYFVYRGHAYWGNDRLEWLLRDVGEQLGRSVPDLRLDPLARPF